RRGQPRLLPGSRAAPGICREVTGWLESSARRGSVVRRGVYDVRPNLQRLQPREELRMSENHDEVTRSGGTGVDACLARHGGLSYLEIPAVDTRQSAAFYEKVFGWNLRHRDTDDPRFDDATGHLIGRWVTGRAISREPGVLPYFYVDRIDDAVNRVVAHGGEVVQ